MIFAKAKVFCIIKMEINIMAFGKITKSLVKGFIQ
jgi:hypothetical protein